MTLIARLGAAIAAADARMQPLLRETLAALVEDHGTIAATERRRAKDRRRKRSAESKECAEIVERAESAETAPSSPSLLPPTPPNNSSPTPCSPSSPLSRGAPTFHAEPYLAAYSARFPGSSVPGGRFAKVLKPLEVRHGAAETLRRWLVFLPAKGELGPEYFARTWSEWDHPPPAALARNGAKATAAEQMTASMSRIFTPVPKPSGRSP